MRHFNRKKMLSAWISCLSAVIVNTSSTAQDSLPASACLDLANLSLPDTTITSAEPVATGSLRIPGMDTGAFSDLPTFCRVTATVKPTPQSDIRMEVWMPAAGWEGTFEGRGSSGIGGAIPYADLATSLRDGYATAGSDTGHQGDSSYALTEPEKVIDFGYRSGHEVPVKAKLIMNAYYGQGPDFSFINGCGGSAVTAQNALQRYPDDYDAVAITGMSDKTHHIFHQMWNWDATHLDEASYIPPEKYEVLHNAVIEKCDLLDRVQDGVIENPQICSFDPASIQCPAGTDGVACLTEPQVVAVRKIYAGASDPLTRRQIFPGPKPGSEMTWVRTTVGETPFRLSEDFFKYFVYKDANWTSKESPVNYATDVALADSPENLVVNALDPDISDFVERGGKLLIWEGWNDTYIPPDLAIDYYNSVLTTIGPIAAKDAVRMFMVPNKEHCGWEGALGTFDVGATLKQWVDTGIPPERITISGTTDEGQPRTRALCPYPQVATYTGSGSTEDAASYACNAP